MRVLIIDDEPLIRWSLSETLMERGFEVIEAGDAASALMQLVDPRQPDVVLLDYRLPDSQDLTLLAMIRRLAPNAQVVLMTAYGTHELATSAGALGAYTMLNKPFELGDLANLVVQAHAAPRLPLIVGTEISRPTAE